MSMKIQGRAKRHRRVRKKVLGLSDRPRLCVFRSARHIYAQVIDDIQGKTLAAAGTTSPEIKEQLSTGGNNKKAAALVGKLLAERATAKNVNLVVFDRGGYKFHGRVKELAEAARKGGLKF